MNYKVYKKNCELVFEPADDCTGGGNGGNACNTPEYSCDEKGYQSKIGWAEINIFTMKVTGCDDLEDCQVNDCGNLESQPSIHINDRLMRTGDCNGEISIKASQVVEYEGEPVDWSTKDLCEALANIKASCCKCS